MKNIFYLMMFSVVSCGYTGVYRYKAQSCVTYPVVGGSEIECPDGSATFIANGSAGQTGATGAQGSQGIQGNPGQNGSSVTVVPLCTGTSTYGTFVEVGFCIGGQLYGTYSANGGFSTLLAPGGYSSNGINSTCTFTVAPNCVVTH